MVRPAELGEHRADGGVLVAVAANSRGSVQIAGLKDLVRLVVAVAGIDGTDEREAIEQRRLLRQVLANENTGEPGCNRGKRAAVLVGTLRFDVPRIDVAGPAGHPQEDHAFAVLRGTEAGRGLGTGAKKIRQGEARKPGQAGFEHPAAAFQHKTFAPPGVEKPERVLMVVFRPVQVLCHHESCGRLLAGADGEREQLKG